MNNQTSNESVYDTTIRLFILLLVIAWCLMLMSPFISVIMWSFILGLALFPMHNSLSKKLGGKPKLASFIIIFCILVIIIFPAFLLAESLVKEVELLKSSYDNGTLSIPPPTASVKEWPIIGEKLFVFWQSASDNLQQLIVQYKDQLINIVKIIAGGILSTVSGIIQIILSLIIAGVLLTIGSVGEEIRKFFRKVGGSRGDEFADITLKTVGSVVKGVLGESLILSIMFGITFALAAIPFPGILTLIVFIFAVVQIPALTVTIPVIIYLFATTDTMFAIIWSVILILVGLSDNILTPLMLSKGAPVPTLVIFIGAIGGFVLSGFIGLFTGAIVMSIGYNLFIDWINSETNKPEKIVSL